MKSYHLSLGWTMKDLAWTLQTKLVATGKCTSKQHSHHDYGIYSTCIMEGSHRLGFENCIVKELR